MHSEHYILVGGRALEVLGSSRHPRYTYYLMDDPQIPEAFIFRETLGVGYLNASGYPFFAELYAREKGRSIASPQSLLELKGLAYLQHLRHQRYAKVDDCYYDIKFLARTFELSGPVLLGHYVSASEMAQVTGIFTEMRRQEIFWRNQPSAGNGLVSD